MPTFYIKKEDADLIHYGVLGMKWGVRRYQNPDGSYTAAGKRRIQAQSQGLSKGAIIGGLAAGPVGAAIGGAIGAKRAGKDFDIQEDQREAAMERAKNMSDQELFETVQTQNLIKQYNDIFSKDNKNVGEQYVKDLLSITSSTASIVKDSQRTNTNIKKVAKTVGNVANKASNINIPNYLRTNDNSSRLDTKGKTLQELQREVNRARLEQQYTNLYSEENQRTGLEYVKDTLAMVATAAGTAAAIVNLAKLLKG